MLFNRINVDALDRIIIREDDIKRIGEVIDIINNSPSLNEELTRLEYPFSEKGIISYKSNLKNSPTIDFYYSLKNEGAVELSEIDGNGNILFRISLDVHLNPISVQRLKKNEFVSDDYMTDVARRTVILLVDFMKYTQFMNYTKQKNPIIIKRAVVNGSSQNGSEKHTNDARSTVSVSKPKKVYDYEQAEREGEKRSYERQAESWEVAGHWRHYKKSDKRVFVKGHKKGEGIKKGKDYTI